MRSSKVKILIVDDDELDRRSIKRAFKGEKIANPIIEAENGQEALDILKGKNGRSALEKPYLILLDINMPVMNGHQFLDVMRSDKNLEASIVFVLSTSDADQDKNKAYSNNIAGYLLKKNIGNEFMAKIKMLDLFMLSVEFPGEK